MALETDRRRFLLALAAVAGAGSLGQLGAGCAPAPSLEAARHTLMGLWDAAVPGTWNGVVEDRLGTGAPAPGANDAGVQEWLESVLGQMPGPLAYITDWFLRAWAADLDLWADSFHFPLGDSTPTFGDLPLGPSLAESGRQYKVMLMQGLFDGIIDIKYLAGITLAKVAFYCDFWAEASGTPRVGGPYIGFNWPSPDPLPHTYNSPFGRPDPRMLLTDTGLLAVP